MRFPTSYRTEAGIAGDPRYIEQALALIKQAAAAGGARRQPAALVACGARPIRSSRAPSACRSTSTASGAARCRRTTRTSSRARARRRCSSADVVLIFGTPLDFRLGYGRDSHINPAAKLIQVDLDPRELGPQPAVRRRHHRRHRPGDGAAHPGGARRRATAKAMVKPWLDEMRQRERAAFEKVRPRARVGRGADQPAARVQGDRRLGR